MSRPGLDRRNLPRATRCTRRALCAALLCAYAAPAPAQHHIETLAEGLEHPWSIAFLPDGRKLVTERTGRLRMLQADGALQSAPIEGVPVVRAAGQGGLMEVALAPDFVDSAHLYLTYACGQRRAVTTCLARASFDGARLDDLETIFRAAPLRRGDAHYGGRLVFLPDGTLLLTLGDGFSYREQAQNPANHLGTIVRLDADGSVPQDNPFVGNEGYAPEIYTIGHRNVQGIVYDADNGRIISHEHGPRGGDELNVLVPGRNYGWPAVTYGIDYTGALVSPYSTLPGYEPPLLHWTPSIAPAGMTLYDGDLFPEWRGDLLISALTTTRGVHRVRLDAEGRATELEILFAHLDERLRDVRTGPDGAVYLLTDSPEGRVLRVIPSE